MPRRRKQQIDAAEAVKFSALMVFSTVAGVLLCTFALLCYLRDGAKKLFKGEGRSLFNPTTLS